MVHHIQRVIVEKHDEEGNLVEKTYKLPAIINTDIGWQLQTGWQNPSTREVSRPSTSGVEYQIINNQNGHSR